MPAGRDFFKFWKLEPQTIEFLTHVCALYRDDGYNEKPALEIVIKMQASPASVARASERQLFCPDIC